MRATGVALIHQEYLPGIGHPGFTQPKCLSLHDRQIDGRQIGYGGVLRQEPV
jgi:hypothetical protein